MNSGILFLIVGPSGVGKDTLLDGARERLGANRWFSFPRRIITRPSDAGGEDHIPATAEEFDQLLAAGKMMHHWSAHGLRYGVPVSVKSQLDAGINVVLNTSRKELAAFRQKHCEVIVVNISASASSIENRLRKRGRETDSEIESRLARMTENWDAESGTLELANEGTPETGILNLVDLIAGSCGLKATVQQFPASFGNRAMCLMHSGNPIASRLLSGCERVVLTAGSTTVVAELGLTDDSSIAAVDACALSTAALSALSVQEGDVVDVIRSPSPKSRGILRKKIRGGELDDEEMEAFVHDLVRGRFSASEISGFLVSASRNLSLKEIISLTRVRAQFAHRQNWQSDIVVDKHSMGGVPGNRVTPIVVPIVAAYGLIIPKTSSRAITSAAGTADMMEVLSRVDLSPDEMTRVVSETGACIAWNGKLTHSPVDDVMNAINRPLGLSSALLDVSSIMSKKLAAGSTHVLIDLPVGPQAKTTTIEDAEALALLYTQVGEGVGLNVKVNIADGTRPIGRGIGPVLETVDVVKVLKGQSDASVDLQSKAVGYAGLLLEWAGDVPAGKGEAVALDILSSGKAYEKLREIADSQGAHDSSIAPGTFQYSVRSEDSGVVNNINIRRLADIARATGAPLDKGAGIEIHCELEASIHRGDEIFRIFSSSQAGLDDAKAAVLNNGPVVSLK
jgi:thymidine phosphorylase